MNPIDHGWLLAAIFPASTPSKCPPHTPDDLKRIYVQAANAAKRHEADSSGAMSRKVIDVSTKQLLGEDAKNLRLEKRIDALADQGKLTPALKDWAHEIRLGGNDAAHDEDPFSQPEAEELLDFVELYLTYIYSLPARLKERRERAASEKSKAGAPTS